MTQAMDKRGSSSRGTSVLYCVEVSRDRQVFGNVVNEVNFPRLHFGNLNVNDDTCNPANNAHPIDVGPKATSDPLLYPINQDFWRPFVRCRFMVKLVGIILNSLGIISRFLGTALCLLMYCCAFNCQVGIN